MKITCAKLAESPRLPKPWHTFDVPGAETAMRLPSTTAWCHHRPLRHDYQVSLCFAVLGNNHCTQRAWNTTDNIPIYILGSHIRACIFEHSTIFVCFYVLFLLQRLVSHPIYVSLGVKLLVHFLPVCMPSISVCRRTASFRSSCLSCTTMSSTLMASWRRWKGNRRS